MFAESVKSKIEEILSCSAPVELMNKETLVLNLVFMLQVIKASNNLIKQAILNDRGCSNFDMELNRYLTIHEKEEEDHDKWLERDLADNGVNPEGYPIMRKAVEMAGTQYYMINHVHPVAILGYMAVLEGFPVGLDVIEKLEEEHGKSLLRTLRYHAENDLDHREDVFKMIDSAPDDLHDIIMQSAIQTAIYIVEVTHQWRNSM